MRRSKRKEPGRGFLVGLSALVLVLLLVLGFLVKSVFFAASSQSSAGQQMVTSSAGAHSSSSSAITPEKAPEKTWTVQEAPVKLPILMYHAIHDMAPEEAHNANLIVAPEVFESHVRALAEAGYHFLTPQEAHRALTENALPADKVVWLTFDDSLWDFHAVAFPILEKYGAVATNNVITGLTESGQAGHLSLAQLHEMLEAGQAFEAHTVTHPDLSATSSEGQETELVGSKAYLDRALGQETTTIVYPAGRYNDTTVALAEQAGYKLGLTTNEGLASLDNGLLTLNRVRILPTTTAEGLLAYIENR